MAIPTVPDCITLTKRDSETWQQFGDRLLAELWLRRRIETAGASDAIPADTSAAVELIDRASNRLDRAGVRLEYATALNGALRSGLDDLRELVAPDGVRACANLALIVVQAQSLIELQHDNLVAAARKVRKANNWVLGANPRATATPAVTVTL